VDATVGGVTTATATLANLSSLPLGDNLITAVYSGDTNYSGVTSAVFHQTIVAGPTTTTLSSSGTPSVFGQTVTFTAQVTAGSSPTPPTGTVFFLDGTTQLGTGDLSGGIATFTTSTLAVTPGDFTSPTFTPVPDKITARYGGTATFTSSLSNEVDQIVDPAQATTTLVSNANPSVFGQLVTFTATVAAVAPGGGTPSGTVAFTIDPTAASPTVLTGTLVAGVATVSTSTLSVGTHSVVANYVGDSSLSVQNYRTAGNSTTLTQIVNQADTTVTLTSDINPSNFGNTIILKATVTPTSPGAGNPATDTSPGTVTFMDGTTVLDTMSVAAAASTGLEVSTLTKGTHSLTAVYSGDSNFNTATSAALTQTVVGAATLITLSDTPPSTSPFGQAITLKATVAYNPGFGTTPGVQPSGTVTFSEGSTVLGTVTLTPDSTTTNLDGNASFTINNATNGSHTYTAQYSGDNFYAASTATLTHTVSQSMTTTTVSSSLNPAVVGQTIKFTVNVAAQSPGGGTPTGTVTLVEVDPNTGLVIQTLGSGTLASGSATISVSSLAQGSHTIVAMYGGDSNFLSSQSPGGTQALSQLVTLVPFIFVQ
jgi:hypothetical protein